MSPWVCLYFATSYLQTWGSCSDTSQIKKIYKASPLTLSMYASFESVALSISGPMPSVLAVVYRPPKYCNTFLDEFCAFLTSLCTLSPNIILLGDFNIHVDSASNSFTRDFNSCLDSFGLHQYVGFPTHSKGHTLDLVCCLGVLWTVQQL